MGIAQIAGVGVKGRAQEWASSLSLEVIRELNLRSLVGVKDRTRWASSLFLAAVGE